MSLDSNFAIHKQHCTSPFKLLSLSNLKMVPQCELSSVIRSKQLHLALAANYISCAKKVVWASYKTKIKPRWDIICHFSEDQRNNFKGTGICLADTCLQLINIKNSQRTISFTRVDLQNKTFSVTLHSKHKPPNLVRESVIPRVLVKTKLSYTWIPKTINNVLFKSLYMKLKGNSH